MVIMVVCDCCVCLVLCVRVCVCLHRREQQRLANRMESANLQKRRKLETQFRITGTTSTAMLRKFYVLTDSLQVEDETEWEVVWRGMLVLSFLYARILSTLVCKFYITLAQLIKLQTLGHHYLAMLVLFNRKIGANEMALCLGIPLRLRRYFDEFKVRKDTALGCGVLGSMQGIEGLHWRTRISMLLNTSGRHGCWGRAPSKC